MRWRQTKNHRLNTMISDFSKRLLISIAWEIMHRLIQYKVFVEIPITLS